MYVDNLLITSKDQESIVKCLLDDYELKLKGTGPIKYHLGCDFFRDSENALSFTSKKYVEKIISIFRKLLATNLALKFTHP